MELARDLLLQLLSLTGNLRNLPGEPTSNLKGVFNKSRKSSK